MNKLISTLILMAVSTFATADFRPEYSTGFNVVSKEVSEQLTKDYNGLISDIETILKANNSIYTDDDIKKAAITVSVAYSPCKYTRHVEQLDCTYTRDRLINNLYNKIKTTSEYKDKRSERLEKSKNDIRESFKRTDWLKNPITYAVTLMIFIQSLMMTPQYLPAIWCFGFKLNILNEENINSKLVNVAIFSVVCLLFFAGLSIALTGFIYLLLFLY